MGEAVEIGRVYLRVPEITADCRVFPPEAEKWRGSKLMSMSARGDQ
jgi:hypothetical protein